MALWDHVADRETGFARPGERPAERRRARELPAFLAEKARLPRTANDDQPAFLDQGPADELDCLRHVLEPDLLRRAEGRARELGIGADQVLIRWGVIEESIYLQHLLRHTGIVAESFATVDREDSPLADTQLPFAAASGLLPLRKNGELIWSVAPRGLTARTLCRFAATYRYLTGYLRLTSAPSLQQFLIQQGGSALAHAATRGLHEKHPAMSAAPEAAAGGLWSGRFKRGCSVTAIVLLPPVLVPDIWSSVLALSFLTFVALRLTGAFWPRRALRKLPPLPDSRLPVYTIIAALYREATSVAPLMQAIDALDYPREKLDVILVVEPNDLQTRAAIARLGPMPHVRTLIAPAVAPQTKPKALNWALPFARGSFVAVFDAEDRPEAGQLRAALEAFRVHGDGVACAQASLCIDNETHNWLSLMFAAEYAGHFDVYLPGMSELGLPLPLGGSSNHFRTAILREVGGWDAYNVTEDADLGFRLARFGYRSVTFASTTFEEAPIRFHAWLKQRSRWMKGWLQTWRVHMRQPRQLWRDAGPAGFVTLNIIAGGNVVTALAYPIMLHALLAYVLTSALAGTPLSIDWPAPLYLAAFAAGCISTLILGIRGLARRGRLRDSWILMLTGLYWICLSIAAWRAVLQYIWNPYRWEKTEHGVAKRAGDQFAGYRFAKRRQRRGQR
ncbi:MAG: glycosyl transferase, family 2 [Tardiphaga sp.]|nr:glycosyl transferase, family 2 [Tardiphaga sp.]